MGGKSEGTLGGSRTYGVGLEEAELGESVGVADSVGVGLPDPVGLTVGEEEGSPSVGETVGDDVTGGGPERWEDPRRVTRASPGEKAMTPVQEPEGSRERSTPITRVTDSPGRKEPDRAENSSQ